MKLTIKYKDGLRERKRTILNVCAIKYVECHSTLCITINTDERKEKIEIKGEIIEANLEKESDQYESI